MDIKAAVLSAPNQEFEIKNVELNTELHPHEILVKVVATGLCHTDLTIRDQQMPFPFPSILGHEGAGVVEKVGSEVTKVKAGDHVVLAPASCGKCTYCKDGHPSYCENFFPLNFGDGHRPDGSCPYHDHSGNDLNSFFFGQSSFAAYSVTAENNVVKVPTDVPLDILGPLGCGLQTGAGAILNVLKPNPGESIVVFGVGPVGLAGIMAAKAAGCTTIIAVDVHDNRLELAKELGATHVINSRNTVVSEVINNEIQPGGVYYSFDTTGRNDVIEQAIASLRYMGRCALVGVSAKEKMEFTYNNLMMGRSIQFVIEGDSVPDIFIPRLISMYKSGIFPFDKLIKFYELDEINKAVEESESGVTLKAIIRMPK
jgi:aryl-alcohol dehydrogenase